MTADSKRERALAEFHRQLEQWSFRQQFAVGLLVVACALPAISMAGFTDSFFELFSLVDWRVWLAISAVAGAVAGAILFADLRYWYVGVGPGFAAGPSVFLATYLYSSFRDKLHLVELFVPFLVGIFFPYLFYYYVLRWWVVRELERTLDRQPNQLTMPSTSTNPRW